MRYIPMSMMGVTPLVQFGFSWHDATSDDFQELSSPRTICLGFFISILRSVAKYFMSQDSQTLALVD
jgi:hypothetical protein